MRPKRPLDRDPLFRRGPQGVPGVGLLAALALAVGVSPSPAAAQETCSCRVLCVPDVAVEPTLSIENLLSRHRTATLRDGVPTDTTRAERELVFEIVVAVGIPTRIPRVDLTLEAIWAPLAGTDANPFTGRTAEEAGREEIREMQSNWKARSTSNS